MLISNDETQQQPDKSHEPFPLILLLKSRVFFVLRLSALPPVPFQFSRLHPVHVFVSFYLASWTSDSAPFVALALSKLVESFLHLVAQNHKMLMNMKKKIMMMMNKQKKQYDDDDDDNNDDDDDKKNKLVKQKLQNMKEQLIEHNLRCRRRNTTTPFTRKIIRGMKMKRKDKIINQILLGRWTKKMNCAGRQISIEQQFQWETPFG